MSGNPKKTATNIEINRDSILLLFSNEDTAIERSWSDTQKTGRTSAQFDREFSPRKR